MTFLFNKILGLYLLFFLVRVFFVIIDTKVCVFYWQNNYKVLYLLYIL